MPKVTSPTKTFARTGQSELDDALARLETVLHELWQAGCALEDAPRDTESVERLLSGIEGRVETAAVHVAALR